MEEKEEAAPPEDDGWMEVGKRNRTVITRTVSCLSTIFFSFFQLSLNKFNLVVDKSY